MNSTKYIVQSQAEVRDKLFELRITVEIIVDKITSYRTFEYLLKQGLLLNLY